MTSTPQRASQPASPDPAKDAVPSGFSKGPGSSNRGFASMDPERQRDAARQTGTVPQTSGTSTAAGSTSTSSGTASRKGTTGH